MAARRGGGSHRASWTTVEGAPGCVSTRRGCRSWPAIWRRPRPGSTSPPRSSRSSATASARGWANGLLAYIRFFQRRFADAELLATKVRAEALELGDTWAPAMMDSLLASIRLWSGRFTEAEELSRRALHAFRELGDRFGMVQALAPRVRSLIALGRTNEAERAIEETMSLGESYGDFAFPAMIAAGAAVHLGPRRAGGRDRRGGPRQDRGDGHRRAPRSVSRWRSGCARPAGPRRRWPCCSTSARTCRTARAVHAIAAALTGDFRLPARRRRRGVGRRRVDVPRPHLRRRRRGGRRVPHRRHGVAPNSASPGRRRSRSGAGDGIARSLVAHATGGVARTVSTTPASSGWKPGGGCVIERAGRGRPTARPARRSSAAARRRRTRSSRNPSVRDRRARREVVSAPDGSDRRPVRPAAPRPFVHDRLRRPAQCDELVVFVNSSPARDTAPGDAAGGVAGRAASRRDGGRGAPRRCRPTSTTPTCGTGGWRCSASSGRSTTGPHVVFSSRPLRERTRRPVRCRGGRRRRRAHDRPDQRHPDPHRTRRSPRPPGARRCAPGSKPTGSDPPERRSSRRRVERAQCTTPTMFGLYGVRITCSAGR